MSISDRNRRKKVKYPVFVLAMKKIKMSKEQKRRIIQVLNLVIELLSKKDGSKNSWDDVLKSLKN